VPTRVNSKYFADERVADLVDLLLFLSVRIKCGLFAERMCPRASPIGFKFRDDLCDARYSLLLLKADDGRLTGCRRDAREVSARTVRARG
jgi:hypothetical protein